jgi:isopentenyl diphosphate isomerase/L-lactate dehydrogenase-like FMN-dependent dehydrogenase
MSPAPAGPVGRPQRFLDRLEERAGHALPEEVFRYVRQGSRDGVSAAEAAAAWDRFRFTPPRSCATSPR